MANLRSVFARFREFDLKFKPKKVPCSRGEYSSKDTRAWKWEIRMWRPSGTG